MTTTFTELDTEIYYDTKDSAYRSNWNLDGSVHWGLFDDSTGQDFPKACDNLNKYMAERGALDAHSIALDIGCGNGNTPIYLATTLGCRVTGVDLSGVRIGNALVACDDQPIEIQGRLAFEKATATNLPFGDESFSHVYSQSTIYHVHNKELALQEAYRVLVPNGTFVFDDLFKPSPVISDAAREFVFNRLLFDTEFSFDSYQDVLRDTGFEVVEVLDLTKNLKLSYQCLVDLAISNGRAQNKLSQKLSYAYQQTVEAIDRHELGWGFYLCRKASTKTFDIPKHSTNPDSGEPPTHPGSQGRPVEERAQGVITQKGLSKLVHRTSEVVDSEIPPSSYRGGQITYRESIENTDDWEIVVTTKVDVTREERFDLSLRVGESLSRVVAAEPDPNWINITFRFDLASRHEPVIIP